jgi:ATP synthase protein I
MSPADATGKAVPADNRPEERAAPPQTPQGRGGSRPPVQAPVERRDDESQGLAEGYRKGEPYMAASSTLVASAVAFTALGYWLDRKMGHSVQWLLLVGAVVGMVVGFVSFFTKVLRPTTKR